MTSDGNVLGQGERRVVAFRRREGVPDSNALISIAPTPPPLPDLDEFERAPGTDHYWHRMAVNGVALAFTILLMAIGIWLAVSIASLRNDQDCVLMARPSCTPMDLHANAPR